GAMFFGGVAQERLQFNEKTMWTGSPEIRGAYQNFGNLYLDFAGHEKGYNDYRRELDLEQAIGTVVYRHDGIVYMREYFASHPDSVLAIRMTTPGASGEINFSLRLVDAHEGTTRVSENGFTMTGTLDLVSYEAQVKIVSESGRVVVDQGKLTVTD